MNILERPEKSLRNKLARSKSAKLSTLERNETSVIFVDKDLTTDDYVGKKLTHYDEEIKSWCQNNNLEILEDKNLKIHYENFIKKIYLSSKNIALNGQKLDLKTLLQQSNIKEDFTNFNRAQRKRIAKRLDSLLFQYDIFFALFEDPKLRKIILSENLKFLIYSEKIIEKKFNLFFNIEEMMLFKNILFKRHHDLKMKSACLIENPTCSILIEKLSNMEEDQVLSFKRIATKGPILLDLMKDKTISLEDGKTLMNNFNSQSHGLIIAGSNSTGKTRTLSAVTSTLSTSKFLSLSGMNLEFKNSIKDYYKIPGKNIVSGYTCSELENLAGNIFKSQVKVNLIDDCTGTELALAWLLSVKYNIPSIISINTESTLNTILHLTNTALNLLNYQNEREFFLYNLTKAFPLIMDLNDFKKSSFIKTDFKNNNLQLKKLSGLAKIEI